MNTEQLKTEKKKFKKADKLLKKIRHILTYRDTDDVILNQIRKVLKDGGYPFIPED